MERIGISSLHPQSNWRGTCWGALNQTLERSRIIYKKPHCSVSCGFWIVMDYNGAGTLWTVYIFKTSDCRFLKGWVWNTIEFPWNKSDFLKFQIILIIKQSIGFVVNLWKEHKLLWFYYTVISCSNFRYIGNQLNIRSSSRILIFLGLLKHVLINLTNWNSRAWPNIKLITCISFYTL